jgi:hypothetical protein
MKVSEVKKLIGQEVWVQRNSDWRPHLCKILAVAGRNLHIDSQGSNDWYWLPDCRIWTEKPEWMEGNPGGIVLG